MRYPFSEVDELGSAQRPIVVLQRQRALQSPIRHPIAAVADSRMHGIPQQRGAGVRNPTHSLCRVCIPEGRGPTGRTRCSAPDRAARTSSPRASSPRRTRGRTPRRCARQSTAARHCRAAAHLQRRPRTLARLGGIGGSRFGSGRDSFGRCGVSRRVRRVGAALGTAAAARRAWAHCFFSCLRWRQRNA